MGNNNHYNIIVCVLLGITNKIVFIFVRENHRHYSRVDYDRGSGLVIFHGLPAIKTSYHFLLVLNIILFFENKQYLSS